MAAPGGDGGTYATVRELHDTELRIIRAIQDWGVKVEAYQSLGSEAHLFAKAANDKATSAHKRIDNLQTMWIATLGGWLVTALGGGWALWQLLQLKNGGG